MGLGGVMLETTDWSGGLRDRMLVADERQHAMVDEPLKATIAAVKANVFGFHGL